MSTRTITLIGLLLLSSSLYCVAGEQPPANQIGHTQENKVLTSSFSLTSSASVSTLSDNLQKQGDSPARQVRASPSGHEIQIINGEDAERGRYPWFVRLVGPYSCGGSLLTRDMVLTTASCDGFVSRAEVGRYDRSDPDDQISVRPITETFVHPLWKAEGRGERAYDLMIAKLDRAVNGMRFPPINLNSNTNIPNATGDRLTLLGFGSLGPEFDFQNAEILQEAPTEYVTNEECAAFRDRNGAGFQNIIGDDWLCTFLNTTEPPRNAHCFGDGGGPVAILGDNHTEDVLVGVISGSANGCANPFLPDISQRVSHSIQWIIDTACANSEVPLAEWNCPTPAPISDAPTPAPVLSDAPTPAPVSDAPTTTPSVAPTQVPVPVPVPESDAPTPAPSPVTTDTSASPMVGSRSLIAVPIYVIAILWALH